MDDAVAQAIHLPPWDFRVRVLEIVIQSVAGQFSYLQNIKNTCLLKHAIVHKGVKIHTLAVVEGVIDMVDQFGMTRDFHEAKDAVQFIALLPDEFNKFKD